MQGCMAMRNDFEWAVRQWAVGSQGLLQLQEVIYCPKNLPVFVQTSLFEQKELELPDFFLKNH